MYEEIFNQIRSAANNGISRIPRFMHTVPVLLYFLNRHSQGYRCINN